MFFETVNPGFFFRYKNMFYSSALIWCWLIELNSKDLQMFKITNVSKYFIENYDKKLLSENFNPGFVLSNHIVIPATNAKPFLAMPQQFYIKIP